MNETRLTCIEIEALLESLIVSRAAVVFDENGQYLSFVDGDGHSRKLTLPLILPRIVPGDVDDILGQIRRSTRTYTIVLIQAGAAALGFLEGEVLKRHKVIKKYMVRQKQGKSQITYLKSKGKSRLGSRIRLKNSIAFFEEINETLASWDVVSKSETLLIAVPVNLKNLLYTANVPPPFEKRDPRIKKVPLDIRRPCLKELEHVNWVVSRGILRRLG